MKHWTFAVVIVLVGCGARVEIEPGGSSSHVKGAEDAASEDAPAVAIDSGSTPEIDAGPVPPAVDAGAAPMPGCPTSMPTSGQSCIASSGIPDQHFYCHYFTGDGSCSHEFKCTQHDGTGEPAHFYDAAKRCDLTASQCSEGASCGSFVDADEACVVECARACRCDRTTGTLHCESVFCGD